MIASGRPQAVEEVAAQLGRGFGQSVAPGRSGDAEVGLAVFLPEDAARLGQERHGFGEVPRGIEMGVDAAEIGFDLVAVLGGLDRFSGEDLERALGEIDSVLRPGGVLFVGGTADRFRSRQGHSFKFALSGFAQA